MYGRLAVPLILLSQTESPRKTLSPSSDGEHSPTFISSDPHLYTQGPSERVLQHIPQLLSPLFP